MPGFGRFETVDELASSGPFTVYSARAAGEAGPARLVLKTFRTQDDFADAELLERQAGAFLAAATLQQGLAKASPGSWAPVHDLGRTETHAYYVTDLYPETGQRLVDSRRELSLRAVAGVVRGVCDALEALHAVHPGRGHGAVRPGNVLVRPKEGGAGELEGAGVFLSDPEPPSDLGPKSQSDDLRELADLLHQLVTHRPAPKAGAVERSEDWTAYGDGGEALRALCEAMLNPAPGAPLMTPADIRARLDACLRMKPPKKGSSKGLIAVIAAVVLIGGGVGAFLAMRGGGGGGPRPDQDGRLRFVERADQWLAEDERQAEALLSKIEAALLTGSGTPEDDTERERLAGEFSARRAEITALRAESFPTAASATLAEDQRRFNERVTQAERNLRSVQVALSELNGRVKVAEQGGDPRGENPMQWMSAGEKRLRDAYQAASAELDESGDRGREELTRLRDQYDTLVERIGTMRGHVWDPPLPEGADVSAQAEAARARVAKQASITAEVPVIAAEVRKLTDESHAVLEKSRGWLKDYLSEQRARVNEVTASAVLGEAYTRMIGLLGQRADQKKIGWSGVRAEIQKLEAWTRGVESAIPTMAEVPRPAGTAVDFDLVTRRFADERDEAMRRAASPVIDDGIIPDLNEAGYQGVLGRLAADLATKAGNYRTILQDATSMEFLLANGYATTEEGPTKATIAALRPRVEALTRDTPMERAVERVLERVVALERVEALSDAPSLVRAISDAGAAGEPSRAWGAWRKIPATGFPAKAEDVATFATIAANALKPALEKIPDAARRTTMMAQAERAVHDGWIAFVRERAGSSPEEVTRAFESMSVAKVTEAEIGAMEPWVRFNYERWKFLGEVARVVTAGDKDGQIAQIMPVAQAFCRRWDSEFASLSSREGMAGLRKQLGDMAAGKVVDLREEGPGRVGWAGTPAADGSEVTYTWKSHTLRFIKVREDTEKASFLATTEVPLRLFVDVMDSANGWSNLPRMGPKANEGIDGRAGPVVWRWWTDAGGRMEPNPSAAASPKSPNGNGWFTQPPQPMSSAGYYPAGMQAPSGEPAPPTWESPMTWLSPQAAVYAAAWMGCRLPTPEEWQEARQREGPAAAGDANRRDALWGEQHAYITELIKPDANGARPFSSARFPSGGILRVRGPGERAPSAETDNKVAVEGRDGWLWFRPVNDGGGRDFKHLEGNVAEWVYTNAAALDALLKPDMAAVNAVFGRFGEGLGVLGASALSPPEYAPEAVLPCVQGGPTQTQRGFYLTESSVGYSDVGFRPAFTTGAGGGAGTPKDRLLGILRTTPYLARGGSGGG
ncbi:MAG: hypothetical protein HBSAPP03_26830 [Phycisphaerae bacterium]|nr:MAG: hypothetical protein HBSAPP03_26830 [Phycisphaerae bacterium]